jgi:Retrotransposon gag protein
MKTPKIYTPTEYHRDRSKLKPYLVQCELYIGFHAKQFETETGKVLWATSFLRGKAFD